MYYSELLRKVVFLHLTGAFTYPESPFLLPADHSERESIYSLYVKNFKFLEGRETSV